mmetsp:Transcript_66147/g.110444  ORF Transcript_66147/g.110444 Transcript_66147/m.110444 type:complete len:262 (+) Transcript_66147:2432-3217(+)
MASRRVNPLAFNISFEPEVVNWPSAGFHMPLGSNLLHSATSPGSPLLNPNIKGSLPLCTCQRSALVASLTQNLLQQYSRRLPYVYTGRPLKRSVAEGTHTPLNRASSKSEAMMQAAPSIACVWMKPWMLRDCKPSLMYHFLTPSTRPVQRPKNLHPGLPSSRMCQRSALASLSSPSASQWYNLNFPLRYTAMPLDWSAVMVQTPFSSDTGNILAYTLRLSSLSSSCTIVISSSTFSVPSPFSSNAIRTVSASSIVALASTA